MGTPARKKEIRKERLRLEKHARRQAAPTKTERRILSRELAEKAMEPVADLIAKTGYQPFHKPGTQLELQSKSARYIVREDGAWIRQAPPSPALPEKAVANA